jgi:hypothetical protein
MLAVLGEEDIFEVWLATDDIDQPANGRRLDDRTDRPVDPHPHGVALADDVLDPVEAVEDAGRDRRPEQQLDMMKRQSPDCLDSIDLDQATLANDRDPSQVRSTSSMMWDERKIVRPSPVASRANAKNVC